MFYYIETFGCQMNKNDSELMALSLSSEGFVSTDDRNTADIIIFNTCSVRKHAETRALTHIRQARAARRKAIVVVAGCMAQRDGVTIVKQKIANIAVGPYQAPLVGTIISDYIKDHRNNLRLSLDSDDFAPRLDENLVNNSSSKPWHRFVTITHGCENFCSYCIVPFVRGKLISFSSKSIIDYILKIADSGVSSVTLLGQNVNQYGQDNGEIPFYRLLDQVASIESLKKINFITSHPKDFNSDIACVIRDHDSISRSIHLPLQSGSDSVLSRMKRGYTLTRYYSIVDELKDILGKNFSLSTDLIVGFPGETEGDHVMTLDAVRTIRFSDAFTYAYSVRDGTEAATLHDDIPHTTKIRRLNELITLQREINASRRLSMTGMIEKVIIERKSSKNPENYYGKTTHEQPIIVKGDCQIGSLVNVIIRGAKGAMLVGEKTL
jgi:tRNA-2-methylthio-N6-dimethylallyladenosine synthase